MSQSTPRPMTTRPRTGAETAAGDATGVHSGLTVAQAYARFMILFFFVVGFMSIIRPITDAPGDGFIMWPEAGKVFGIFLINWFHFVLHIMLAIWAIIAMRKTSWSRAFGWGVFWPCAMLVLIGLLTPQGVWLVPANWPADASNNVVTLTTTPNWYGFIPANIPDDIINSLVGLSGLIIALHPVALRPWGYWRDRTATA